MRDLLKYLRNYKKESVLGPLFKLLEASFELLVPLVMAQVIDTGIKHGDVSYILKMGGVLLLLGIVGLTCSLTAQYFAAKAAVGFGTALRNDLFAHMNRLSYAEIDQVGTSTLITRMTSDINQVQSGVNLFLRLFLRSPFIVFGAMIMAFTVNVPAAMVFVVIIPLLSAVVFGIMAVTMPLYKNVQKQLDQVLLSVRENLSGVRVIRAFNRQDSEMEQFERSNRTLEKMQIFVGKISALMNPMTYVMINLATLVLVWTAGRQVDAGIITQGETVALVNYMSQILVELVKLANLIVTISKSLACAGRISQVFKIQSSITDGGRASGNGEAAGGSAPAGSAAGAENSCGRGVASDSGMPEEASVKVELSQVDFSYGGSKVDSLSGISLKVKRGETIGIIGGTGSGKSTLVNLLPRFYDVRQGAVLMDGVDVREYELETLRRKFGIVPQKAVLFKGTLRDNMKFGKKDASDEEIYEALTIAQAADFVKEKGMGLELPIAQHGANLSGGQRQRLTIARALVRKPEILIMDDSGSALDFATDHRLRTAIREHTDQMTVFIVSQRVASLGSADRILVLDDGRAAGLGTHEELLASCEIYREICQSQAAGGEERAHA